MNKKIILYIMIIFTKKEGNGMHNQTPYFKKREQLLNDIINEYYILINSKIFFYWKRSSFTWLPLFKRNFKYSYSY